MNSIKASKEFGVESRFIKSFLSSLQVKDNSIVSEKIWPKISVVMPSFNHEKYIERSILSVINQGYPNLEFIIVDGKSTDKTSFIVEKYMSYISIFRSEEDKGQSDALNHGFSMATGEIFAWLNSDDVYLPGALFSAAQAFRDNDSAKVVYGDWWSIDSDDNVISLNYAFDFSINHFIFEGFHLNSQAMFWQKSVHRNFGDFDINLHKTMDYDMILRFGINEGEKNFYRVPVVFACFRRHKEQKSENECDPLILKEQKKTAKKNKIYNKKYGVFRYFFRFVFRVRRAWWYIKRAGLDFTLNQINK
jgi:glycosyltransferase involved in cell wall biosynthesis